MFLLTRVLLLTLVFLAGCRDAMVQRVTIFAAASTREALRETADSFQAKTGISVEVNAGPSSTLARQIDQGANADLFLSADEEWADYLGSKGLVAERRDLLANRLVVIVPKDSSLVIHDIRDLAGREMKRLALAGPAVPAGHYAREALSRAGTWEQVKNRVLEGADVRATLAYVARGEAEAGLVYATDAAANPDVTVAMDVNPDLHEPIRYPLVLIRRNPLKEAARSFYEFIRSDAAADSFKRRGFVWMP